MDVEQKTFRLMTLQSRLLHGEVLRKRVLAQEFGVSERSIRRDLENLRVYFEQQNPPRELIYSRAKGGFRLDSGEQLLTGPELLYICKILLESRSIPQREMEQLTARRTALQTELRKIRKEKKYNLIRKYRYIIFKSE